MARYKLLIEYDGAPFVGWQIQDQGASVQGTLIDAIEAFCGERVKVQGAGRTDTGVHALGQVAHVDLAKDWAEDTVRDALTAQLRPHPVAVLAAKKVPETFDARMRAFLLLKQHGQQLCKRTKPKCPQCPVSRWCAYFAGSRRGRASK